MEFGGLRRSLESKLSRIVLQVTCASPIFDPRHLRLKILRVAIHVSGIPVHYQKNFLRFMDKEAANGDQYNHENVTLLLLH